MFSMGRALAGSYKSYTATTLSLQTALMGLQVNILAQHAQKSLKQRQLASGIGLL